MSKGSTKSANNDKRLKAMEQVYLQRIESTMKEPEKGGPRHRSNTRGMSRGPKKFTGGLVQHPAEEAKKIKPKVKPFRTTIDRFTDNPAEVHKGMNFALDTTI